MLADDHSAAPSRKRVRFAGRTMHAAGSSAAASPLDLPDPDLNQVRACSCLPFLSRRYVQVCDEYNRFRRIGEGTYGIVYRGHNKKTNMKVALKKINLLK